MTLKGYQRAIANAGELRQAVVRFESAGVSADNIFIGDSPQVILDNLLPGDVFVIRSFIESGCNGLHDVCMLLWQVSEKNAVVRTLEEPVIDTGIRSDWATVARNLMWIDSICRSEKSRKALERIKKSGRKLGRPAKDSGKRVQLWRMGKPACNPEKTERLRKCLAAYYKTNVNVKQLCLESGFGFADLYSYIARNNLPCRQDIRENPQLRSSVEAVLAQL